MAIPGALLAFLEEAGLENCPELHTLFTQQPPYTPP